jgi:hypothetical protein
MTTQNLYEQHRAFVSGDPVLTDIVNSMRVYFDNLIFRVGTTSGVPLELYDPMVPFEPRTISHVLFTQGRAGLKCYSMFDQCDHTNIGVVSMSWLTTDL